MIHLNPLKMWNQMQIHFFFLLHQVPNLLVLCTFCNLIEMEYIKFSTSMTYWSLLSYWGHVHLLWLFVSTQWAQGIGCSTYKPRQSRNVILLIKVGFRVLFDQGSGDLANCSLQSNQVIVSSTYSLEQNAPNELIVTHKFNLEAILCFCKKNICWLMVGIRFCLIKVVWIYKASFLALEQVEIIAQHVGFRQLQIWAHDR
jgi:hypothetical protein